MICFTTILKKPLTVFSFYFTLKHSPPLTYGAVSYTHLALSADKEAVPLFKDYLFKLVENEGISGEQL